MSLRKIISILVIALTLGLLFATIPALPALAAAGTITVTSSTGTTAGPVGTTFTIIGTGFTSSSTYTVQIDSVNTFYTGAIVAGGLLPVVTLPMPAKPRGTHTIAVVTDAFDNTSNPYSFIVTPQIVSTPLTGRVGSSVGIAGTGFIAGAYISVNYDGVLITSASSDITGSFTANFSVPQGTATPHTIVCTDGTNSQSTTFTVIASLTLSAYTAKVGDTITVTGSGFASSSTITISLVGVPAATTQANAGSFSYNFTIPATPGGANTISASDGVTTINAPTLTITPNVPINPTTFNVGGQVTINGTGLAASSPVTLSIDGTALNNGSTTTGANGSFTISNFTIPAVPGGSHNLQVIDVNGTTLNTFTFAVGQSLKINPQSGQPGTNVQVAITGFSANKNVTVTFDGTNVNTTASLTDPTGALNTGFVVPTSAGGTHTLSASDGTFSGTASFSIDAQSTPLTPANGPVGQVVKVGGSSFVARGNITVTYDSAVVTTIATDASGAFTGSFKVPPSATGNHAVSISDGTRKKDMTFAVIASATIDPVSGYVDTPITITGTGFASRGQVTVKYDTNQAGALAADANGGFALVFNAPISKGGNHTLIVTDGSSTINLAFAMDSTPPPVPQTVLPPIGTKADKMATLSWTEVSSKNGVSYILELAKDPAFSDLVFPDKVLSASAYTLTQAESLKPASKNKPYYWRVRAIDGASNTSAWSPPSTFYVGNVFPGWIIYAVLGIAIVIVGVGGFWLGGRLRHRSHI